MNGESELSAAELYKLLALTQIEEFDPIEER